MLTSLTSVSVLLSYLGINMSFSHLYLISNTNSCHRCATALNPLKWTKAKTTWLYLQAVDIFHIFLTVPEKFPQLHKTSCICSCLNGNLTKPVHEKGTAGPGLFKAGSRSPRVSGEFDSRSESFKINSVEIFLLAIWSLDVLKRLGKIFPKRL